MMLSSHEKVGDQKAYLDMLEVAAVCARMYQKTKNPKFLKEYMPNLKYWKERIEKTDYPAVERMHENIASRNSSLK